MNMHSHAQRSTALAVVASRETLRASRHRTPRAGQGGFTLIELLISMTIVGVLISLGYSAYNMVVESSRERATKSLLAQLGAALDERMESFMRQPLSTASNTISSVPTYSLAANSKGTHNLGSLIERAWAMRCSFPQCFYECMKRELDSTAQAGDKGTDVNGVSHYGMSYGDNAWRMQQIIYLRYLMQSRQPGVLDDPQVSNTKPFIKTNIYSTIPDSHTPNTESSECLYLILSSQVGGENFTIDQIPNQFIADTDGDGMLEIVDAWGTPVRYYRWPTDYFHYLMFEAQLVPETMLIRSDPSDKNSAVMASNFDPTGYLTAQPWFGTNGRQRFEFDKNTASTSADRFALFRVSHIDDPSTPFAYPVRPLIISAGRDREFGIYGTELGDGTQVWNDEKARLGQVLKDGDGKPVTELQDNIIQIHTSR